MRILIAEDEARMAEQLRRGLEREGYSVLLAADGERALELARNGGHDLLILDWMLPVSKASKSHAGCARRASIHGF